MVKGISRQVIVVQSPDPMMFEQAIFILNDDAIGKREVTEEALLKEANKIINRSKTGKTKSLSLPGLVWTGFGAMLTGLIWLFTAL